MKTLEDAVSRIFALYPELCGFSVEDAEEPYLADLALEPGYATSDEVLGGIATALIDLMDEDPDARELLRGRTFARTVH